MSFYSKNTVQLAKRIHALVHDNKPSWASMSADETRMLCEGALSTAVYPEDSDLTPAEFIADHFANRTTWKDGEGRKLRFSGSDTCLDTSLFEHLVIWTEDTDAAGDVRFLYLVRMTTGRKSGASLVEVDWAAFEEDLDPRKEFDWVDWDELLGTMGADPEEYFERPLGNIIADLAGYYGHENVFGTPYYTTRFFFPQGIE